MCLVIIWYFHIVFVQIWIIPALKALMSEWATKTRHHKCVCCIHHIYNVTAVINNAILNQLVVPTLNCALVRVEWA